MLAFRDTTVHQA